MPFSARRQKQVVVAPQWTQTCGAGGRCSICSFYFLFIRKNGGQGVCNGGQEVFNGRRCSTAGRRTSSATAGGEQTEAAAPGVARSSAAPGHDQGLAGVEAESELDRGAAHTAGGVAAPGRPHPREDGFAPPRGLLGLRHGGSLPTSRGARCSNSGTL